MFEQDYIMRFIKEMVRVLLKLVFNIDTNSPSDELLQDVKEKEVLYHLCDLVDKGNINEAENKMYDIIQKRDMSSLKISLLFYSYLNEKDNHFLEDNDFSRKEIKMGLEDILSKYGLKDIAEMF